MFSHPAVSAPIYSGPGWVDAIPLGSGSETWQIDWTLALQDPVGATELINTTGSAVVERSNASSGDGSIDIEMVSLSLTGNSSLGPVSVTEASFVNSLGRVTQLSTAPTLADSFFDVFFELDIGGTDLFITDPLGFTATGLTGYPPDGTTYTSLAIVDLLDANGNPTGFFLSDGGGMTVSFDAAVIPVPAAAWLFGTALLGLIGLGKRKSMLHACRLRPADAG